MTVQPGYITVNINVNGKAHKVKIQQGIGIDIDKNTYAGYSSPDTVLRPKNGSLFCWEEKTQLRKSEDGYTYKEGLDIYAPKSTKEIKMTEAEFSLFKNVADNVKEDGDAITLSRADIVKAQELFSQGKYTSDISKNLPKGFYASKDIQDMRKGVSLRAAATNYDKNKEALANAKGQYYQADFAGLTFYNKTEEDKYLEKYSKMSSDGCVKRTYQGEGDGGACWTLYTYKDKDGNLITESPDYNSAMGYKNNNGAKLMRFEGKDSEGKSVITEYYDCVKTTLDAESEFALKLGSYYSQIKTSKTPDGKDFIELYEKDENDKFHLKHILIKYKNGDKNVVELKDENGNPSKKIVDYVESGKKVHEDYDKDNKLVKKTVEYTRGKDKITEEYNSKKQLIVRDIQKNGDWTQLETEYYENNKFVKKEKGSRSERYIKGDTIVVDNKEVTKCAGFNAKEWANKELSEKAKEYKQALRNQTTVNIARTIKDQINGPSGNSKTIAMVKAIPADKFIEVLRQYNNVDGWLWFDKSSLFTDLTDEWFMDSNELTDIAKQAFAVYLQDKSGEKITEEDIKMAKFVQQGPTNDIKEYMLKVENYILK